MPTSNRATPTCTCVRAPAAAARPPRGTRSSRKQRAACRRLSAECMERGVRAALYPQPFALSPLPSAANFIDACCVTAAFEGGAEEDGNAFLGFVEGNEA